MRTRFPIVIFLRFLRSGKVSKGVIFCGKTYDYLNPAALSIWTEQHQHWPEGRISLAKNSMTVWWIPIVMSHWVCWHFPMELEKPILMSTCAALNLAPLQDDNHFWESIEQHCERPASVRIIHGWQQIRVEFFINLSDISENSSTDVTKGIIEALESWKMNGCRKRRYFARFWPYYNYYHHHLQITSFIDENYEWLCVQPFLHCIQFFDPRQHLLFSGESMNLLTPTSIHFDR